MGSWGEEEKDGKMGREGEEGENGDSGQQIAHLEGGGEGDWRRRLACWREGERRNC